MCFQWRHPWEQRVNPFKDNPSLFDFFYITMILLTMREWHDNKYFDSVINLWNAVYFIDFWHVWNNRNTIFWNQLSRMRLIRSSLLSNKVLFVKAIEYNKRSSYWHYSKKFSKTFAVHGLKGYAIPVWIQFTILFLFTKHANINLF